jgi:hypothetical protein
MSAKGEDELEVRNHRNKVGRRTAQTTSVVVAKYSIAKDYVCDQAAETIDE